MTVIEKLQMTIEVKLRTHQHMVAYHEAKDELVKAMFHEGIVASLMEMLKIIQTLIG